MRVEGSIARLRHRWIAAGALAAVVAAVAGLIALVGAMSNSSSDELPPIGQACEDLFAKQAPDLMAQATKLLDDESGLSALAACDSGGYPTAEGTTSDRVTAIVDRMRQYGSVKQAQDTECLKYLEPADCGAVWEYQPRDSERRYRVWLDPRTEGSEFSLETARAEFSIQMDR